MHRQVKLLCGRDKRHHVGSVYLPLPPHPEAGRYLMGDGVRFLDAPGELGGELIACCRRCDDDVQQHIKWARVHRVLADVDQRGQHVGVLILDR